MRLDLNVLEEKDLKNNFSEILIEVYNCCDLKRVIAWCKLRGYKMASMLHIGENDKKTHCHVIIKSDSQHRFNVKSLTSDTLVYYNFKKCKTTIKDFAEYVTHRNYDDKRKYKSDMIYYVNVTPKYIKEVECYLNNTQISSIEDRDIYNKEDLDRKIFNCQFMSIKEIIEYCNHTPELRNYFIRNSVAITNGWLSIMSANMYLINTTLKKVEKDFYGKKR